MTRRCWSSSRPPAATFMRRRKRQASGIMLRFPSSERTGRPTWLLPRQGRAGETDCGLRRPLSIIRSTQFMEFLGGIADSGAVGNVVRMSPGLFQPIAADDVAPIVAEVALAAPRNGIVEIAGPDSITLQRNRRAIFEGDRRSAPGRERPQGPILRRSRRGALARPARRSAPGSHRPRRMAPPGTEKSLNHRRDAADDLHSGTEPNEVQLKEMALEAKPVVHSDPDILGGTPVFIGTRVPLRNLIDYLEAGESLDEFLDDFPSVSRRSGGRRIGGRPRLTATCA